MTHNQMLYLVALERNLDLRSGNIQRSLKQYPDKERQPRLLKHWVNR